MNIINLEQLFRVSNITAYYTAYLRIPDLVLHFEVFLQTSREFRLSKDLELDLVLALPLPPPQGQGPAMARNVFTLQAITKIEHEVQSRDFFVRHHYRLPLENRDVPNRLCEMHRGQDPREQPDWSVLKDRALMPMCRACVKFRLDELLDTTLLGRGRVKGCPIDTCVCAATVTWSTCWWCALDAATWSRQAYVDFFNVSLVDEEGEVVEGGGLTCLCGRRIDEVYDERLRLCAACDGVVEIPCHAINGIAHLVCAILQPSKAILPMPQPEHNFLGNFKNCTEPHPVRLAQHLLPRGALASLAAQSLPIKPLEIKDMLLTIPTLAKFAEKWPIRKDSIVPLNLPPNSSGGGNDASPVDEHQQEKGGPSKQDGYARPVQR